MPPPPGADRAVVLFILPSGGSLRGGARSNLLLTQYLAGVQPHVLTFRGSAVAAECRRIGVPVHEIDARESLNTTGSLWRRERRAAYRRLIVGGWAVSRRIRPAIVQSDYEHFPVAVGIGWPRASRTVVYVRGWLTNGVHSRALLKFAAADAIVAVSRSLRDSIIQDTPAPFRRRVASKISFVRNSVAMPDDDAPRARTGTVAIVGAVEPLKNQLELLREWCERAETRNLRLQLVGPEGDAAYAERCRRHIASAGGGHSIEMLGFRRDMEGCYRDLDVLICASRREGSPRAILEAASYGVPSVALDFPGADEVIVEGRTGLVCASPGQLVQAVLHLQEDDPRRRSYGLAAKDHVRSHFDPRRNAALVEEQVYKPLTNRR